MDMIYWPRYVDQRSVLPLADTRERPGWFFGVQTLDLHNPNAILPSFLTVLHVVDAQFQSI